MANDFGGSWIQAIVQAQGFSPRSKTIGRPIASERIESLEERSMLAVVGDFDFSGMVDQFDYQVWKSNFGSSTELAADGNGDGVVDAADYTVWRNNLGAEALPARSKIT